MSSSTSGMRLDQKVSPLKRKIFAQYKFGQLLPFKPSDPLPLDNIQPYKRLWDKVGIPQIQSLANAHVKYRLDLLNCVQNGGPSFGVDGNICARLLGEHWFLNSCPHKLLHKLWTVMEIMMQPGLNSYRNNCSGDAHEWYKIYFSNIFLICTFLLPVMSFITSKTQWSD